MKKMIILVSLLFPFVACARPDYVSSLGANENNNPQTSCAYSFPVTGTCATLIWKTPVSSSGYSEADLQLETSAGVYDDITVVLWMPSMGHGSAPVEVTNTGDGHFALRKIYFVMPGDWEMRISLLKAGEKIDSFSVPLFVP